MLEQDWMINEIEATIRTIAKIMWGRDSGNYTPHDMEDLEDADLLHQDLVKLLEGLEINTAENKLADNLRANDTCYLNVALDFYTRLNQLSDETLEAHDFSREEILEGLDHVKKVFQIPI